MHDEILVKSLIVEKPDVASKLCFPYFIQYSFTIIIPLRIMLDAAFLWFSKCEISFFISLLEITNAIAPSDLTQYSFVYHDNCRKQSVKLTLVRKPPRATQEF